VGSTDGMERARRTSPLYGVWLATAAEDVDRARDAVRRKDLQALGEIMESSTYKMHATMHTSKPPLHYWLPGTMAVLHEVANLRRNGIGCWATMDAGPNVKVLCAPHDCMRIEKALKPLVDAVEIVGPGPAPRVKVHT
jgi:diphosphomevalonate decarboxylase